MKFISILISIICILNITACAEAGELSNREAKKVINEHIGTWYCPLSYKVSYRKRDKKQYEKQLKFFKELRDYQLVTFSVNDDKWNFNILVKPTEKAKPIKNEFSNDEFGISGGKRSVEKIIKIDGDTVFFSYWFKPNNLGKALGYNKCKFRGKAKISYDMFLDKFLFKGFYFSPWEKEEWRKTTWVYQNKNHKFYRDGIID